MKFTSLDIFKFQFSKKKKKNVEENCNVEEKHNNAGREIRKKKSIIVEGKSNRKWTGRIDPENPIIRLRNDGRSGRKKKSKSIDLIFHGDWVYARDSDENGTADGLPGK